MASSLYIGVAGFDITPRFHPQLGAWGTTPFMTEVDLPLQSRCFAMEQNGMRLIWFGSDLVGSNVAGTDALREEIASALGMTMDQVIWSTSQTHSSGAIPGSRITGSVVREQNVHDSDFATAERQRLIQSLVDGARQAQDSLQPARAFVGTGNCSSASYNRRLPLSNGGVKFSRDYIEGLQGGKYFDSTIALVRFDGLDGEPLGAIFNFCCHPATMINAKWISPDWVGTARQYIEDALGGAPTMFVQGMCGDVLCYHIFGTPSQAKSTGERIGRAAVEALPQLTPIDTEPMQLLWQTIKLPCRPMYTRSELEFAIEERKAFIDALKVNPGECWFCGMNAPEFFTAEERASFVKVQIDYLKEGLRILDCQEVVQPSLPLTVGALRMGEMAFFFSPGENFTATGLEIRKQSPFANTMICGDSNGLFGYVGDDTEIDRGGIETDGYWKLLSIDGFRLAPAKGSVQIILQAARDMLSELASSVGRPNNTSSPTPALRRAPDWEKAQV